MNILDILLPKLHKEGHKFVTISLIITFVFLLISKVLGLIGLVITIWVFYFLEIQIGIQYRTTII